MRILMEALGFGEGDNLGGSVRVAATNARALAARGHEVWFCCTNLVDKHRKLPGGSRLVERDGVKVVYCDTTALPFWPGVLGPHYSRIPRHLLPPIGSFDVVHLTEFRSFLAPRVGVAALDAGVPLVLQPQGTFLRHDRSRGIKRLYDALWGDRLAAQSARVIAATRTEAAALADGGVEPARIRVVPNGIELPATPPVPLTGAFRRTIGLPLDVPMIVSVGRVDEVKGFDLMVRAMADIPAPVTYVVVGPDHGYAPTLTRIAEELSLGRRFVMTGALPHAEDVHAAIADADLMVVPSRYEAFGQVILEGLIARRPMVLSSGCNTAADFEGRAALVAPPEPAALAAACRELLQDPERSRALGESGFRLLQAEYTVAAVTDKLERLYGEAAAARAA